MKKISEMTLTELQDYALTLEQSKTTLEADLTTKNGEIEELRKTNNALQDRNNKLFMQVEQSVKGTEGEEDEGDPAPVESCEEFALKNLKGLIR